MKSIVTILRNKKMIDLTETSECPENIKKEIINKFMLNKIKVKIKVRL
jgi:hypothetical protein